MFGQYWEDPTVSIIIPAHNAGKTLAGTIEHVIRQTHRALDIVVVDDGSTDDTASIIEEFVARDGRISHLHQANGGVAAARNLALAHAKGVLVAPLDADDIWHPTKIAKQVEAFRTAPGDCGLVYCRARTIDAHDRVISDVACPAPVGRVHPCMLNSNFIRCASIPLIRRDLLEHVGGYDTSLRARGAEGSEDLGLYLRLAELSRFAIVDEYLVGYRQTGGNMSTRIDQNFSSWHLVLDAARERHPELPGWLYRWAAGNFHRWLGFRAMAGGETGKGTRLLLRALAEDPWGTLKTDVIRAWFIGLAAAGAGALGVKRHVGDAVRALAGQRRGRVEEAEPAAFLDLDPARPLSAPVGWETRRMNSVAQLSVPASGGRGKSTVPERLPGTLPVQDRQRVRAERT